MGFCKKLAPIDKAKAWKAIKRGNSNKHFGESPSKFQTSMLEGGLEAVEFGLGMDPMRALAFMVRGFLATKTQKHWAVSPKRG